MSDPAFKVNPSVTTDFPSYYDKWQYITANTPEQLPGGFADGGRLMNYAFLPAQLAADMIARPDEGETVAFIQFAFAAVPVGEEGDWAFTVIFLALNQDYKLANSTYYIAGVADQPALLFPVPAADDFSSAAAPSAAFAPISTPDAQIWIENWNNLQPSGITSDLFISPEAPTGGALCGYTYTVDDFTSILPENPSPEQAIWLNFALHSETVPNPPLPHQPFFMALCLNAMPVPGVPGEIHFDELQHYRDLSKPCPPFCHVIFPPKPHPHTS